MKINTTRLLETAVMVVAISIIQSLEFSNGAKYGKNKIVNYIGRHLDEDCQIGENTKNPATKLMVHAFEKKE